jgi:hypothetical protein
VSTPDVIDAVRSLLPSINLRTVEFHEQSARRIEGSPATEGERAPVTIQMDSHVAEDFVAYRFNAGVERSDVHTHVSVVVAYDAAETTPLAG